MKTYYDQTHSIIFEDLRIPKDSANTDYANFLREQEKGEAELVPYVAPVFPTTWDDIRAYRNSLLTQSDWAIIADATPRPNKEAWLNYRQALRDITVTYSSPEAVVWPTKPS